MGLLAKIKRYYLFFGNEEYLKSKRIKSLIDAVIEKGYEDFDCDYFEGRGLDATVLINAASSPPLGSPLRVVVLRNLDKVSPKGLGLIERFIGSIPDYTTLIITCEKIDKRKKIFKTLLADENACVHFGQPSPSKAVELVAESARQLDTHISAEARDYLVETVGPDIGRLEQELAKLALYVGPDATIQKVDVAQMCGVGGAGTIFDLPERITSGDIAGAFVLLNSLLLAKQSESKILFRVKDYFLKLNTVKALNASPWLLVKKFGMLEKTAENIYQTAKRLPEKCITNCIHYIYECEIGLKSTGLKKDVILFDLISRLGLEVKGE